MASMVEPDGVTPDEARPVDVKPTGVKPEKPDPTYVIGAVVLVVLGLIAGQLLVQADVSFEPKPEMSVFAVLYVLAQGVERFVEFVISAMTMLSENFAENRKRKALAVLNSTANGNPGVADITGDTEAAKAETEAKSARLDIALFAQGLGFALSYALVSYFEFGIFRTIGVENLVEWVDRVLTAVAVMGGSKGLHELVGRLQKSKEASESGTSAAQPSRV